MLDKIHDALLIYNPASGRRRDKRLRDIGAAARILKDAGIVAEAVATTGPGSATDLARNAVGDARQLVIVCGGDGTINEAVNGLAASHVPLAVLPAGTANILAKELDIPWNIPAAARLIARGSLARIALGEIAWNENSPDGSLADSLKKTRYFLCVSGAGPDGAIVHGIDLAKKLRLGIWAYWQEGLRQFFTYRFARFRIRSREHEMEASLIVVGRTKYYGGPFRITTGASLFENAFEIVAYEGRSRFGVLMCLPAIWLGCLPRVPGIHHWKTTELTCEAIDADEIFSQVDGEPAAALPVRFRIVPDALTLVLPEGAAPPNS
ncbi:MAG TPA: diacylglycerol kinase family protein [Candidatus Acidoferrales bacterium]|nr:diacylglycerol kinase family protein [Candidatus Acidoferrales bacterium]